MTARLITHPMPRDAVAVAWKDEDSINGVPIGPAWWETPRGLTPVRSIGSLVAWATDANVIRLARQVGLPFKEV